MGTSGDSRLLDELQDSGGCDVSSTMRLDDAVPDDGNTCRRRTVITGSADSGTVIHDQVGNPRNVCEIGETLNDALCHMDVGLPREFRGPRGKTFTRQDALGILTGERNQLGDYLPALRSSR